MRRISFVFLSLVFLLSACTPVDWWPFPQPTTTIPTAQPSAPPTPSAPAQSTQAPTAPTVISVRLWVPPQMDPTADTPAGKLLQARLEQFSRQHNDLTIEVRVKSVSGSGGLLDSLTTTSAAAPLALPDLVALPREGLETAALKGLLQMVKSPDSVFDDSDWYEFARQLVRVQNSPFGLPICGDALVTVYRPSIVSVPPISWSEILELNTPFVFPAADRQAIFTLALYRSLGMNLRDEEGRPYLEAEQLAQVLTLYDNAEERGVMPFWLTQYQDDQDVWDAFIEKRADIIVAWLSDYLTVLPEETQFSVLPVADGQNFSLADGWVWAFAAVQDERFEIALELADYLADSKFSSAYAERLGCIAPYQGAIGAQLDPDQKAMVEQIALSARVLPSTDILNSLGLPVQHAVMQVLKNQAEPIPAAQSAIEALTSP